MPICPDCGESYQTVHMRCVTPGKRLRPSSVVEGQVQRLLAMTEAKVRELHAARREVSRLASEIETLNSALLSLGHRGVILP